MPAPSYKTNRTSLITNVPSKFELIHMDTVTIDKPSMYKNKCILTILDDYTIYGGVLFTKKKFSIYSSNGTRKLKTYSIKTISTSKRTMEKNSKVQALKNSVITKALYNNSLSHTTHKKTAVPTGSTKQLLIQQRSC